MASCELVDGYNSGDDCPKATPGAYDTAFLWNRKDVTSYVAGSGNEIADFNFKAGKGFYQLVGAKGTVIASEELSTDNAAGSSYTPRVQFNLAQVSSEARDFVNNLLGPEMGVLVQSKTGVWQMYGYTEGMTMTENTFTTEAGDTFGEVVALTATNVNEKRRIFFDTDDDTTLTNITSKIVGS